MKPLTTMAVGAAVLALGYGAADAQNGRQIKNDRQDVRQDRRELHRDNRDVRQDRRELAGDRQALNQDIKAGRTSEVRQDRAEIRGDRREVGAGVRDRRDDRRDLRQGSTRAGTRRADPVVTGKTCRRAVGSDKVKGEGATGEWSHRTKRSASAWRGETRRRSTSSCRAFRSERTVSPGPFSETPRTRAISRRKTSSGCTRPREASAASQSARPGSIGSWS